MHPIRTRSCQKGFSLRTLVIALILGSVVLALAARLFPVYSEYYTVLSATRSVLDNSETAGLSQNAIRREINQALRINGVRDFDTGRINIVRDGGAVAARIRYEERVPLIYNIDLMISFDDRVE